MNLRNLFRRCIPSLSDFAFLAPAILLFCLMGGVASMLVDADTGWHIRAGEWILDHHQFPTTDFFSFTQSGQPWFAWEWLWEVSFAWLYRTAGMAGVIIGNLAILCLTSLHLFHLVRRRSKSGGMACGVTILALVGMSMYFFARPQLASFLFAVILLRLLEQRREAGGGPPWTIVPLFALWANVHPGFAAGIIILGAYTAGDLANAWTTNEPGQRAQLLAVFRRSLVLMAACLVAALVNPYGYRLYAHMYSFLSDSYALNHINEYRVVNFRTGPGRIFELMLFLSAPAALARLLKRDFAVPALFLLWAHLALTAQRNIPFFMIVMAAPVAFWLEEMLAAYRRTQSDSVGAPASASQVPAGVMTGDGFTPGIPLLGLATMVLIFGLLRAPGSPPKFRPQYDPSVYPEQALAAVRQMGPASRVLTSDLWGGYLIFRLYPDIRVFWDGRADFYGTPYNLAAIDALLGRPGWDQTLAKHGITAVLVPLNSPLVSLLGQSKDWHVVHRDELAILFELPAAREASR
ncbi:MAG: hypothetical protein ABI759_23945 [Candidatus Solibacter sp.]